MSHNIYFLYVNRLLLEEKEEIKKKRCQKNRKPRIIYQCFDTGLKVLELVWQIVPHCGRAWYWSKLFSDHIRSRFLDAVESHHMLAVVVIEYQCCSGITHLKKLKQLLELVNNFFQNLLKIPPQSWSKEDTILDFFSTKKVLIIEKMNSIIWFCPGHVVAWTLFTTVLITLKRIENFKIFDFYLDYYVICVKSFTPDDKLIYEIFTVLNNFVAHMLSMSVRSSCKKAKLENLNNMCSLNFII